jgi:thiol-disulfide isomerase/thioredoxin
MCPRFSASACIVIGLLALAATAPSRAQDSSGKQSPKAGAAARIDLPLIDLAGYNKILGRYRGKPLLVTFWATWCEPCRDEFPTLIGLAKQYAPQGLAVFGVSLDDNADMNLVRHFLAEFRPGFPNYRQNPQIDVDEFYRGVNPNWQGSMPETIFYSRDGRIAQSFTAEQTRTVFDLAIRGILGAHTSSENAAPVISIGN